MTDSKYNLSIINFCVIHSVSKLMLATVFLYGWIILLILYMFISIVICYKNMLFFRKTK